MIRSGKGERGGLARIAVFVLVVVLVVGAVGALSTLSVTPQMTSTGAPEVVSLRAYEPNGTIVTNPSYKVGDPFDLSITAQGPLEPVAVHEVFGGTVYPNHSWNVTATGYTYILRDVAHANDTGVHTDYVVVTFANDQQVESNGITVTIAG